MPSAHAEPDGSAPSIKVVKVFPVGREPLDVGYTPNERQGYVTDESSGTVEILNFPQ
jgi:DNA-binding beta-propeller fold protein YncE